MLDLPPLWLSAKPSIIRSASLDDAKLAMPLVGTFAAASVRGLRAAGAAPAVLTYRNSLWSGTDAATYSTTISLGAGAPDRKILVAAVSTSTTSGRTVSAFTVDGISGTHIASQEDTGDSQYRIFQVYGFDVPTGDSVTVSITWSGTQARCGFSVWAVTGLQSFTPVTASVTDNTTSGIDLSINTVTDGVVLAMGYAPGSPAWSWTGVTERFDSIVETAGFSTADASGFSGETPRAVSATFTGGQRGTSMAVSLR